MRCQKRAQRPRSHRSNAHRHRRCKTILVTSISIISDSSDKPDLQAFAAIIQCHERPELLTPGLIQAVHAKLMRTSKLKIGDPVTGGVHYNNAGLTRQTTQKTVVIRSQQNNLAFCPAERVDQQLEYICRMGKVGVYSLGSLCSHSELGADGATQQYIARWRNPFATAAWLHVTFVRCHPFDVRFCSLFRIS
jgi:hypothetical protein